MGVGTGGTLIGVGQAFRAVNPDVRLFAMEPSESQTILCGEISTHHIEGISDGFVPGIFARHSELVDSTLSVSSEEAIAEMRQLARGHGLLCGPSSGAHLIAARRVREQHPEFDTVRSEEHTSELRSLMRISYAVFCLKKKKLKYHTNV